MSVAASSRARFGDVVKAYVALTKPRIIELLLVTTVPAMFLAAGGIPPWQLVLWTLVGGMFAAASANTFNCVIDADIDEVMRRTRRRPVPRHQVSARNATVFGVVLGVLATLVLGFGANWLSAILALAANAFYVFVYTMWLKRRTWQNIVWGGIAGCFPPLIGWTGLTGLVLGPFGGYQFNLAAITAAICMSPEADRNPERRYLAAVWAGIFYLITGLLGATVASVFTALPKELVAAIAGIALLGTIGNSLTAALHDDHEREAALLTFLVTASGLTLWGVGSAFWGLLLGLAVLKSRAPR